MTEYRPKTSLAELFQSVSYSSSSPATTTTTNVAKIPANGEASRQVTREMRELDLNIHSEIRLVSYGGKTVGQYLLDVWLEKETKRKTKKKQPKVRLDK